MKTILPLFALLVILFSCEEEKDPLTFNFDHQISREWIYNEDTALIEYFYDSDNLLIKKVVYDEHDRYDIFSYTYEDNYIYENLKKAYEITDNGIFPVNDAIKYFFDDTGYLTGYDHYSDDDNTSPKNSLYEKYRCTYENGNLITDTTINYITGITQIIDYQYFDTLNTYFTYDISGFDMSWKDSRNLLKSFTSYDPNFEFKDHNDSKSYYLTNYKLKGDTVQIIKDQIFEDTIDVNQRIIINYIQN